MRSSGQRSRSKRSRLTRAVSKKLLNGFQPKFTCVSMGAHQFTKSGKSSYFKVTEPTVKVKVVKIEKYCFAEII